jgi:hypothetical protein
MRQVAIDAAALEAKQSAFFADKNVAVATGLLIGRMTDGKDHVVRVQLHPSRFMAVARTRHGMCA